MKVSRWEKLNTYGLGPGITPSFQVFLICHFWSFGATLQAFDFVADGNGGNSHSTSRVEGLHHAMRSWLLGSVM